MVSRVRRLFDHSRQLLFYYLVIKIPVSQSHMQLHFWMWDYASVVLLAIVTRGRVRHIPEVEYETKRHAIKAIVKRTDKPRP